MTKFVRSNIEPIMIELGGVEYPARLTFAALAELEELTDTSFLVLFDHFVKGTATLDSLMKMLFVALKAGGVDVSLADLQGESYTKEFLEVTLLKLANLLSKSQKVDIPELVDNAENADTDDKKN
ncbi:MAG: gene transfer agent family protein [Turicibacter sp.]|nr:gene transfer agent family protein [Turicibacter sp.]